MDDYSYRLKIIVTNPGDDDMDGPNATRFELQTTMDDCNVHGWFNVFQSVLRAQGFSDKVIMTGATQLAFNEQRDLKMMEEVASFFGLTLDEFNEG